MYNRYVPQPDGSFSRNRMPDRNTKNRPAPPPPPEPDRTPEPCQQTEHSFPQRRHQSSGGFLRQLIPKDFDTGDLIVILLLLLMAGDCEEDRNNAILTIALYFLM